MTSLEIVAALCGLANVGLLVRRSVWSYPFALVMVSLYGAIFWQQRLYSDALLQIFFFVVNIYGWVHWVQVKGDGELPVRYLSAGMRVVIGMATLAACAVWGTVMHRYTDAAAPFWDGSVAMISVTAQILLARRYIENWLLWVVVDILAIGLFASRGLYITTGLYVVFLLLAGLGFWQWVKADRASL